MQYFVNVLLRSCLIFLLPSAASASYTCEYDNDLEDHQQTMYENTRCNQDRSSRQSIPNLLCLLDIQCLLQVYEINYFYLLEAFAEPYALFLIQICQVR